MAKHPVKSTCLATISQLDAPRILTDGAVALSLTLQSFVKNKIPPRAAYIQGDFPSIFLSPVPSFSNEYN